MKQLTYHGDDKHLGRNLVGVLGLNGRMAGSRASTGQRAASKQQTGDGLEELHGEDADEKRNNSSEEKSFIALNFLAENADEIRW